MQLHVDEDYGVHKHLETLIYELNNTDTEMVLCVFHTLSKQFEANLLTPNWL